ncbi:MAG: hypothetical protein JW776_14700 [Candidatus Lokiarchaeota archaeon]|nr:hypothetical protein [Candidatus Lokiarchaeota archaeon]
MNKFETSELYLYGFDLVKFLHITFQLIFVPVALGCLQHNFQILVPLPVGIFILLSIFCNIVVFIPHLVENSHKFLISKSSSEIIFVSRRLHKELTNKYDFSDYSLTINRIHEHFGWMFVFFLGFAWNFYLQSEGAKLLRVKAWYQGFPMFFYGFFTVLFYLVMWFLPDRKFQLHNQNNPKKSTTLLIPSFIVSVRKKNLYFGKNLVSKINRLLAMESASESKTSMSFLQSNWVHLVQCCTWFLIWILGAPFTFDLYHYQFVAAFAFILLVFHLRRFLFKSESPTNPWWIYPFWAVVFHEVGIKAWHVTALATLSPSSIIWTLPVSWFLYILVIGATLLEFLNSKNRNWTVFLSILIMELGLQFTSFLSTYRIIPFFISLIELGPLI